MKTSIKDVVYLVTDSFMALGLLLVIGIAHIVIKLGRAAVHLKNYYNIKHYPNC